jgi:hypothetical protein
MTQERFLDVLGLMETEVSGVRRVWGPRRARVQVGEPVNLKYRVADYSADRRGVVAAVTRELETAVRTMIESLGSDGKQVT